MSEWIYVLELAPLARIKVGRTEKLPQRLTTYLAEAGRFGCEVTRIMCLAVDDAVSAEQVLLAQVAAHPRALLAHGRETFAGISFKEAAEIAGQLAGAIPALPRQLAEASAALPPQPQPDLQLNLLDDVRDIMDNSGQMQMHLAALVDALHLRRPKLWKHLETASLGMQLREAGIPVGQTKIAGRNTSGVRRKDLGVGDPPCRAIGPIRMITARTGRPALAVTGRGTITMGGAGLRSLPPVGQALEVAQARRPLLVSIQQELELGWAGPLGEAG